MKQKELAAKVGMVPPQLHQIESGRRTPSLKTIARLAEALDLEPHDLLKPAQVELAVAA